MSRKPRRSIPCRAETRAPQQRDCGFATAVRWATTAATSSGLIAHSQAATTATRRSKNRRVARNAIGTVRQPASSEVSRRTPAKSLASTFVPSQVSWY